MSKKRNKPFNFNLAKHDDKMAGWKDQESRVRAGEIMVKLGKHYEYLKQRLLHKRQATPEDLKAFLAELETMEEKECGMNVKLDGFRKFTLALIRDKIEVLRLSDFNQRNVFVPALEYQPEPSAMERELPGANLSPVVRYTFKEWGEFTLIEPIRRILNRCDFVGLVLDGATMMAVFTDGSFVAVGTVANRLGLEKVPSREQYLKAMEEKRKEDEK